MSTLYVVHAGLVRSRFDGQWHLIGAVRLAGLYGVRRERWLNALSPSSSSIALEWRGPVVHLHPREDGDYRLPDSHAPHELDLTS